MRFCGIKDTFMKKKMKKQILSLSFVKKLYIHVILLQVYHTMILQKWIMRRINIAALPSILTLDEFNQL